MSGDGREKEVDVELYVKLGKIEEKLDQLVYIRDIALEAKSKALEADQSATSAHKRIDRIDSIIRWVAMAVIGAVIASLMGLVLTGG